MLKSQLSEIQKSYVSVKVQVAEIELALESLLDDYAPNAAGSPCVTRIEGSMACILSIVGGLDDSAKRNPAQVSTRERQARLEGFGKLDDRDSE